MEGIHLHTHHLSNVEWALICLCATLMVIFSHTSGVGLLLYSEDYVYGSGSSLTDFFLNA